MAGTPAGGEATEMSLDELVAEPQRVLDTIRARGRVSFTRGGEQVAMGRLLDADEIIDGLTSVQPVSAFLTDSRQTAALLCGDYKFRRTVAITSPDERFQLEPVPGRP